MPVELLLANGETYELEAPTTFQLVDDLVLADSELADRYGLAPQAAGRSAAKKLDAVADGPVSFDAAESEAVAALLAGYGVRPR